MSQQKALHVSMQTMKRVQAEKKNIDVSQMTAEEYLASVFLEAKTLPEVNISKPGCSQVLNNNVGRNEGNAPIDGSAAMMHYLLSSRTELEHIKESSKLPDNAKEFCEAVIADFSSLRSYLDNCSLGGIGSKRSERIPLPPMRDLAGWHVFCLGKDESVGNVGGYFDDSDVDNNEIESTGSYDEETSEIPLWKNVPKDGMLPSTQLILQMDQVMIRRVLDHHLHWIENDWPISKQRGSWVYALLARLEKPLHREDAAMLRRLLKTMCQRRNVENDTQSIASINVLLAITGRYFQQASFHELFE